jgi:mono/diheme cytochrome c family protein
VARPDEKEKSMKRVSQIVLLSATLMPVLAVAGSPENGKVVFDKWCLACHGERVDVGVPGTAAAMYPGTRALAAKYKGAQPAMLEQRTNLTPEFIKAIVRNGLFSMPRTRKTEISDAELDDLAAYLTQKKR